MQNDAFLDFAQFAVPYVMWATSVAALLPSILLHQVPKDEPIVLERTEEQSQGEEQGQFLRMDTKLPWRSVEISMHMCKGQVQD